MEQTSYPWETLLWTAPENLRALRAANRTLKEPIASRKGDIYSLAIIMQVSLLERAHGVRYWRSLAAFFLFFVCFCLFVCWFFGACRKLE